MNPAVPDIGDVKPTLVVMPVVPNHKHCSDEIMRKRHVSYHPRSHAEACKLTLTHDAHRTLFFGRKQGNIQ